MWRRGKPCSERQHNTKVEQAEACNILSVPHSHNTLNKWRKLILLFPEKRPQWQCSTLPCDKDRVWLLRDPLGYWRTVWLWSMTGMEEWKKGGRETGKEGEVEIFSVLQRPISISQSLLYVVSHYISAGWPRVDPLGIRSSANATEGLGRSLRWFW